MQPLNDKRPREFLTLGRVSGLFGVKGWVKVFSDTQPRENITQYASWWLKSTEGQSDWQEYKVVQARPHGKTIIALIDGINTRESAAKIIDQQVAVPRGLLPEAQDGEYYWADLVGCNVVSVSGDALGLVDRLFETGANDVLVVKVGVVKVGSDSSADDVGNDVVNDVSKESEVLIPWIVPDVITSIDIAAKKIVVDWDPDY